MTLKNTDVITLIQALTKLDTAKFSTPTYLALSKNLRAIQGSFVDIQSTEKKLRENQETFQSEWDILLEQTVEIELVQVSVADLQLDKNHIPVTVLTALYPIISDIE